MYRLPEYITEYKFNQEKLNEIFQSGAITNTYDTFDNLILSTDSQDGEIDSPEKFLILVETEKSEYDPNAVEEFGDVEFSEFTDTASQVESTKSSPLISSVYEDIESDVANQLGQENILQTQIDELSNMLESEADKNVKFQEDAEMNFRAAKGLIIKQRIAAGEGEVETDFSDSFPFLPLTGEQKETGETGVETSPFMRTPRSTEYH